MVYMTDQIVRYIEEQYHKGHSISNIRTALIAAGHDMEHVEIAIAHMFKRKIHHKILFFISLGIVIFGLFVIESLVTTHPLIQPITEQPSLVDESNVEYRRIAQKTAIPRSKEECMEYTLELQQQVCLDKYEQWTKVVYPQ